MCRPGSLSSRLGLWNDVHTVEASDTRPGYVKTRFILSSDRVVLVLRTHQDRLTLQEKHLLSLPNKIKHEKHTGASRCSTKATCESAACLGIGVKCMFIKFWVETRSQEQKWSQSTTLWEAGRKAMVRLTYLHAADFYCLPTLLTITKSLCTLAVAQHSYTYCGLLSKETCTTSAGVLPKRPELQFPQRRPIPGYDCSAVNTLLPLSQFLCFSMHTLLFHRLLSFVFDVVTVCKWGKPPQHMF